MKIANVQLGLVAVCLRFLQASLQYLTSSNIFSHFFRQENRRPQTGQILKVRSRFLTPFGMSKTLFNWSDVTR